METYEYNLDNINLEIFPLGIWKDPHIVFHGTSEFHSEQIERSGFVPATSPFNLEDARELIRVLQLPDIAKFDKANILGLNISRTLNSYVFGIENKDFRLSFAYLSNLSVGFAMGQSKGGQTLGNIREAKVIIQQAIQANPDLAREITEPINRLFQLETDVANGNGVVYAVKLEPPFSGITEEYGNIHSTVAIPSNRIVGKVILPNDIDPANFNIKILKAANKQKLVKPGHLGILLNRMSLNDLDEEKY